MAIKKKSVPRKKIGVKTAEGKKQDVYEPTNFKPKIIISDVEINAIKFNPDAMIAIEKIADGFLQNARGLTELGKVFSLINAKIETGIRIDGRDSISLADCKMKSP